MLPSDFFCVKDTLECGQCFRFSNDGEYYTVYAGVDENVKSIKLSQTDFSDVNNNPFWFDYFDLASDYVSMQKSFIDVNPIIKSAVEYSPGIRILNQDPWEALCSFVVSQNNNIPRIKGIIERMCTRFGLRNSDGVAGFPSALTLANATEDELRLTGLGFRAPYIINTAKAVCNGKVDFDKLKSCKIDDARGILTAIKGIGPKVANCALLFGCHRLDCFPVDTWMKKVMDEYFDGQGGSIFGEYAGLAQQYLFHWIRTKDKQNDI